MALSQPKINNSGSAQQTMDNLQSQSLFFKQLKPLTVPILALLPIKSSAQSNALNPILASINSLILNQSTPLLLTPPMIHYIFFPLEQLYHPHNFQALYESCLNHLLSLSTILVRASKSHQSNPLWLSKEISILNSILPILIQRRGSVMESDQKDQNNDPVSSPVRSDQNIIMALDLIIAILRPDGRLANSKVALNLDNLYQVPTGLTTLSPQLIRFLFEHLVNILDCLYWNFANNSKHSQPSLERAKKTIEVIKLSLIRLSSSNVPGANGIDILSTLLPSMTSKLVRLARLLAQRNRFSSLLGSILQTIEWLLVECLDDELPDIQDVTSASEFQPIDHQLDSDPCSQSEVFDKILKIASHWKSNQSVPPQIEDPAPLSTNSNSPTFHQESECQQVFIKRDKSWLVTTSAKLSIVLQLLSSSLNSHPNAVVLQAWIHMCAQLLDRSSAVLRVASLSSTEQSSFQETDGFRIVIEALLIHRSNSNLNQERIISSLTTVTRSLPLESLRLIVDFIRGNFRSLSNLLVKQVSGQDDHIISLTTRTISSLNLIIQLMNHGIPQTHFHRSGLDTIDLSEFCQLISLCMCRVELVIPSVIEFQPDTTLQPSLGAFSISDHTRRDKSDLDYLPDSFPSLSIKNIFDSRYIKTLEELIRTISWLVLHLGSFNLGGSSSWIRISEITYFDYLLELSTSSNGTNSSDLHTRLKELNALWALGQSVRPSKRISTDDRQRERFQKIEIFCLQGLKKLLDLAETQRVEGNSNTAQEENKESSSSTLIDKITEDLDSLPVTTYLKGNNQLTELEKFKPVLISKASKKIDQRNFQNLRTCLILRLIGSLAYVFEDSFQTNLSWILYYVLAQFGTPDPYVQQHASATVAELSFYCGYGSITNMLEDNSDYLIQAISQKLLPYQYDIYAPFVLEHLIRLVGLPFILPLIEQILLYDFFEILDDYHGYDLICQNLISVFRCVMGLMKNQIEIEDKSNNLEDTQNEFEEPIKKNGIDEVFEVELLLAQARSALAGPPSDPSHDLELFDTYQTTRKRWFELQNPSKTKEDDPREWKNPKKPFGDIEELDPSISDQNPPLDSAELSSSLTMTGYQKIATELINKSANFLTHSSPFVQISVAQLIDLAIPILGSKSSTPQESLLLPCIQKFWPIILNRLDQVYVNSEDQNVEQKQHLIQVEVLHIFCSLCVHVGSFMNKQFMNDIWPRIQKIIQQESKSLFNGMTSSGNSFRTHSVKVVLIESALETLLEIIKSAKNKSQNRHQSINVKENLVWDLLISLNQLKVKLKKFIKIKFKILTLIDLILDSLTSLGFLGSVLVAQKAFNHQLPGMEFLASTLES